MQKKVTHQYSLIDSTFIFISDDTSLKRSETFIKALPEIATHVIHVRHSLYTVQPRRQSTFCNFVVSKKLNSHCTPSKKFRLFLFCLSTAVQGISPQCLRTTNILQLTSIYVLTQEANIPQDIQIDIMSCCILYQEISIVRDGAIPNVYFNKDYNNRPALINRYRDLLQRNTGGRPILEADEICQNSSSTKKTY